MDELLRGRVRLLQPRRGARVSLDTLLVADFAIRVGRPGRVLDLGCGTGAIALCIASARPQARVVGVEIQPGLVALARRNAHLNRMVDRFEVVEGDLRRVSELPIGAGVFDLVVANPPYHGDSNLSPSPQRALSRSEVVCTLPEVIGAARHFLKHRGSLVLVLPADRTAELCAELLRAKMAPRLLRAVHPVSGEAARRILVVAARGYRGGLTMEPPLVIHGPDRRRYTPEAAAILCEDT